MESDFVSSSRRGAVLVWSLIMVAVMTTLVGALGKNYASIIRIARSYQEQTGTDFAAWRALDSSVHVALAQLDATGSTAEQIASALFHRGETSMKDDRGSAYAASVDIKVKSGNGFVATTEQDVKTRLIEAKKNGKMLEVEVVSKATGEGHGGLQGATVTVREVLEIGWETEQTSGLETMKAFNYVYFANNYGHLDGSVVANGEIGGNDRFTINGSRVNGYIDVRGAYSNDTSAVILQNSPKMWPYYYYMKRVVENDESDFAVSVPGYSTTGVDYYTSVRPTDPIYISTTSNIVWSGGYEPPGVNSKYGEIDSSGNFVNLPTNPYTSEVAKYVGSNPYQDDYDYYYDEKGAKENPQQKTYDSYYKENGDYTEHANQAEYYTYYSDIGTARTNPNTTEYLKYWNSNGTAKPYPDQSTLDSLKAARDVYFASDNDYNNINFKSNPYKIVSQATKYWEWQNGKSVWQKYGSKRSEYNSYYKAKQDYTAAQNTAKTNYVNWNNAKNTFDNSGKKTAYETWYAQRAAWIASPTGLEEYNEWNRRQKTAGETYNKWNNDKATASRNFTDWQRTFEDWLNNLKQGGEEVDLTWETAHLSISNNVRSSKRIINVTTNIVDVPNMSDGAKMQEVIDHCKTNATENGRVGGWLRCRNRYRTDAGAEFDMSITNLYKYHREYYRTGLLATEWYRNIEPIQHTDLKRTLSEIVVNGGDGSSVDPFKNDDSAFADTASLVRGSVILIGTEDYPIEIDGPVYFPGDVVIRGFVSGKGTIYAGRNVHIIGDITYLNPPNWPHKNMSAPQNHPQRVAERNKACDVLMLVSRGNIVVGDYTSDIWQSNANMQYLKSYGQTSSACNDFCESGIGYTRGFARDYTQNDGGKKVDASDVKTTRTGTDWMYVYDRWGNHVFGLYGWTEDKYNLVVKKVDRKYYESIFGSAVISGFKQVATADPTEGWKQSSSLRQRIISLLFGGRVTSTEVEKSKSPAAGDITEINAALVSNHGIFGVVGGEGMPQFTLNGAMICRDEGLLPSFTSRFSGYTKRKIWLNWDLRLRSSSAEGVLYGALMKMVNNTSVQKLVIRVKSQGQVQ